MLFERIRRTQKPIFIFLAVMFGLGFVALGVGQGVNGVDLWAGSSTPAAAAAAPRSRA